MITMFPVIYVLCVYVCSLGVCVFSVYLRDLKVFVCFLCVCAFSEYLYILFVCVFPGFV